MFWGFFPHPLPLLSHLPTQAVAGGSAKAYTAMMKTKDITGLLRPSRATDTVDASLVARKFRVFFVEHWRHGWNPRNRQWKGLNP